MGEIGWLQRLSRRVGGPRFLALPFLRGLAIVAGFVWLALTPTDFVGWILLAFAIAGFALYSLVLYVLIWVRPTVVFRLHLPVLLIDLAFALLLVRLSGGAESTLFLGLLLIAGLQSYYYGIRRGVVVAIGASVAYVWVIWPTLIHHEVANAAIRIAVLIGTAAAVGVLADIEERDRLEVAALNLEVRAREQFITNVVESLRDGLVVLDPEGRVQAWNRAMETRYEIQAQEVLGRPFLDVNSNWKREGLAEPIERLLRGEIEEFALEGVEHETLKKGRVILNVKGSLLRENLAPSGAVLLIEDITERVALERSARQAEKLAALGTLSAGLVHELNNPISVISSRIELMLQEAEERRLPPQVRDDLQVLHRHAQRVARIARGLLSFARQSPGDRRLLDLNQIVEDTLLLMEKQVSKEGIMVRRSLAPDLPPMEGDPNALQQVVLNLLTNARDAMDDGGEIRIETGTVDGRPGWLRLVVSDNGPGIPLEHLPKIFDPFYTTKADGTGLGLSISYGIVREHQGTIDVQSQPGKGTTFVLAFPALDSGGRA
ncbi:MAG: PAS domain S-box protein [Candidatus Rokubacteria bacterium]|nr:PAS domain S-box protein [Candidatus Rokubacteria bacterium]MBI2554652.1 PAS domain S-box protein [Candidatus Rokubacteria bacterium]